MQAAGKDGDDEQSMGEYVYEQLNSMFIENIPIAAILEFPTFYLYLFGAIAEIAMLVTFAYFFQDIYQRGLTEKFVSIDSSSGACVAVTKAVTGDFTADVNGYWDGSHGYRSSLGLYELILTGKYLYLFSTQFNL